MLLGVVPARGGSRGIRRKNLQLLNGKPLFLHAADTLAQVCDKVVISTDDPTIAGIGELFYKIHHRSPVPDDQTIVTAARLVQQTGPMLVLQPTCPQITAEDLKMLMALTGVASQLTVPFPHVLYDYDGNKQTGHSNRQFADKPHSVGVGAYWFPDIITEPEVCVTGEARQIIDIDNWLELQTVRAERKQIRIHYRANRHVGTGHLRRMLTLADALQQHDVFFTPTYDTDKHFIEPVEAAGYRVIDSDWADLTITDVLDTDHIYPAPWVTFEDRSEYAKHADLVVNALYPTEATLSFRSELSGPDYVVVRPEFAYLPPFQIRDTAKILIMFGGTDPGQLTDKVRKALAHLSPTIVRPGETRPIPKLMLEHDLLITSAGRTVYEANLVGIPAVVMSQNPREDTHTHLGYEHGNVYLGMGRLVPNRLLLGTVDSLLYDSDLRRVLSQAPGPDGKGVDRIVHRIEGILNGL